MSRELHGFDKEVAERVRRLILLLNIIIFRIPSWLVRARRSEPSFPQGSRCDLAEISCQLSFALATPLSISSLLNHHILSI